MSGFSWSVVVPLKDNYTSAKRSFSSKYGGYRRGQSACWCRSRDHVNLVSDSSANR